MPQFIPAPDLWDAATRAALDSGALRLQPGQWIKCGPGPLSRFYSHNPATGHVVAFHGSGAWATRKLRAYVAAMRDAERRREAARAARLSSAPGPRLFRVVGAVLRRERMA